MGDLMRPAPRRSLVEHAVAVVRWIGIGRILAVVGSVVAVAVASVWLLRGPDGAASDAAPPVASAPALAPPPTGGAVPADASGSPSPDADPATDVVTPLPSAAPPPTTVARLVVHVAGAVTAPGVYDLPSGGRVRDAVAAAGGAAGDAVLDAINLAAPVVDGQQVYVPRVGEASGPAPASGAAPAAGPGGLSAAAPLDLNTASEEQLLDLPGVGPVLAAAIVRHREESGPYTSVDGLLEVSGIGPARLESLRELVRV